MEYKDMFMRRLMMVDETVMRLFKERSPGSADYGRAALRSIFDELVLRDKEYEKKYREAAGLDDEEVWVAKDTPECRLVEMIIRVHGWAGLLEGIKTFAKNRELQLRQVGIGDSKGHWKKIVTVVEGMPKYPQL